MLFLNLSIIFFFIYFLRIYVFIYFYSKHKMFETFHWNFESAKIFQFGGQTKTKSEMKLSTMLQHLNLFFNSGLLLAVFWEYWLLQKLFWRYWLLDGPLMIPRDDIGPVTAIPTMWQPLCTKMANILICGIHMHCSLYQIKIFFLFFFVEIELVYVKLNM